MPSTTWSALTGIASASTSTTDGATFLDDRWAGTANTPIDTRAGDIASWTEHPNYTNNGAGRLRLTPEERIFGDGVDPSGAIMYYASGAANVPASPDYFVEAPLYAKSLGASAALADAGVWTRLSSTTEAGVLFYYNRTSATPRFELYTVRAGAYALHSVFTHTLSLNSDYVMRLRSEGSAHTGYVNDAARVSVVTSGATLAGFPGIRFYCHSAETYNTGVQMGRIKAQSLESIATTVAGQDWEAQSAQSTAWAAQAPRATTWNALA